MRTLLDALEQHSRTGPQPLHMPGHKRHGLDPRLPYSLDITEIQGFDDLHHPQGILKEGMDRAAALWGAQRSFYLIGGSTVGILACVRAASRPGDRVIVARNCHKSVYHALELCGLEPHYLLPQWEGDWGIWGSVTPEILESAFAACPQARLVILTSPTYEGVLSDIESLTRVAHAHGALLMVDEAHGAHLERGAVAGGADLVVQSLHKTLPSLTQTALCHCKEELAGRVARELNVFETSSPSYPLMASIQLCVNWLETEGPAARKAFARRLEGLDRLPLNHLSLLCHGQDGPHGFFGHDPGKLLVRGGCTGPRLAELFRERGLEPEMVTPHSVLLMTTLCDTNGDFARLEQVLKEVDGLVPAAPSCNLECPVLPPRQMAPLAALNAPGEDLPLEEGVGRISGEYLWAYPPGIPFLVPGEEITPGLVDLVRGNQEVELISTWDRLPLLRVVKSHG